jgi:hypothetical protein
MSTKKTEPTLTAWNGQEIKRRFATMYWFDGRQREPSPWSRGYPRAEEGSIEGAGRVVLKGYAAKVQCFDRVKGRVVWTVKRGARVPGTHLYEVIASQGDPDTKPARAK